jgi:hypothetical protein
VLGNICVTHYVDTCSFSIVEFSFINELEFEIDVDHRV